MKLTAKKLKSLIKEARLKKRTVLLAKPAAEYEMAKKLFEQQSASNGEFTEVAYNTMLASSVFADENLNEEQQGEYELEFSIPSNPNPEVIDRFTESLYSGKRSGFLSYYSKQELEKMHLYLIKGHNAGFALKGGNDIVSVHNNSELRGLGKYFLETAKEKGGTMLDHFDGFLSGLYRKYGFVNVYEIYQWDEKYKPASWTYDKVDIYNPNTSVYAKAFDELSQDNGGDSPVLPNQNIKIKAEGGLEMTINPNLKYNQYLYGRPDVIMRRL